MTNEEAVKLLRDAPVMGVKVKDSPLPIARAVEIAIDSLEKRIPKKPHFDGERYDVNGKLNFYSTWLCPNCKFRFEMFFARYDFCHWCGQAIDWSDEQ